MNKNLRIAYISLHWPRTTSSSIGKKINTQINIWREFGHTVEFFSHLHTQNDDQPLVDGQCFFYQSSNNVISTEISRISAANKLLESIQNFHPDMIYLRWGMYVHPLKRLFSLAPTIIEINTNDFEEHKLLGFVKDRYNRLTRSIFLGNAAGHVYTSGEMVDDPVFSRFPNPYKVIANGIALKTTPFYPAPRNAVPHLIFIGTPGMAWHGVDKLLEFAESYPDIHVDIVGYDQAPAGAKELTNVTFHGYLQGEQLEAIFSIADAAIGSLSLHLNNMDEASPFKVRDCASRGIPCILPYKDTDLFNLDCPEILNIPNTKDNILTHGQEIHDFIIGIRGKRLDRALTQNRIDILRKETQRLEFFWSIYNQS